MEVWYWGSDLEEFRREGRRSWDGGRIKGDAQVSSMNNMVKGAPSLGPHTLYMSHRCILDKIKMVLVYHFHNDEYSSVHFWVLGLPACVIYHSLLPPPDLRLFICDLPGQASLSIPNPPSPPGPICLCLLLRSAPWALPPLSLATSVMNANNAAAIFH